MWTPGKTKKRAVTITPHIEKWFPLGKEGPGFENEGFTEGALALLHIYSFKRIHNYVST